MSKKTFNVALKLVRNGRTIRSEQHTNACVAALIEQVKDYVSVFEIKSDEYRGGTLTIINSSNEYKEIGKIEHDGSLVLYETGTSCIYCNNTPKKEEPVYDEDGHCSKCTNKVVIQVK